MRTLLIPDQSQPTGKRMVNFDWCRASLGAKAHAIPERTAVAFCRAGSKRWTKARLRRNGELQNPCKRCADAIAKLKEPPQRIVSSGASPLPFEN